MSTASRVIKNTGYLYAKMGITSIISLVTTRLILNSLGQEDFGIYNVVGGAIAMLGFVNASMASATQRFLNYSEGEGNLEKQKSIFNVSLVLHGGIAAFMLIILLVSGLLFFNGVLNIPDERVNAAKIVYLCLVFSTTVTICSAPFDAILTSHENMRFYALVGVIESVLKLVIALACVFTCFDKLVVYGILMALVPMVSLIIMLVYCFQHYQECVMMPKRYFSKEYLKEMGGFAGWNFLGTSSTMVCNYGQNILVNHFFGVILNAAVGVVSQLTGLTMVFTNSMTKAITPVIVKKAGSQEDESMLKLSCSACRFSFVLLAFLAIPLCFETNYILKLWLKQVPEWTVLFVQLQMVRTLLEQVTIGFNTTLAASGNVRELNIQTTIIFTASFILLAILYKFYFPPYVLYVVMIIAVLLQSVLKILLCRKYTTLSIKVFFTEVLAPVFVLTIVMSLGAIIPTLLFSESFLRLVITCLLCWALLLVSLWVFFLRADEKATIRDIVTMKKK